MSLTFGNGHVRAYPFLADARTLYRAGESPTTSYPHTPSSSSTSTNFCSSPAPPPAVPPFSIPCPSTHNASPPGCLEYLPSRDRDSISDTSQLSRFQSNCSSVSSYTTAGPTIDYEGDLPPTSDVALFGETCIFRGAKVEYTLVLTI